MKVPLSWLKEYLNLTQSPEELAKVLTLAGIEVESIEASILKFSGVVVGKVLETLQHPSADRLCVAKVSDGQEEFQVVCGASNCRPGIKTAFAKIGAALVDEEGKSFKIKKSKLRDVESFGMLCSEKELGLGAGHEGIMELTDEFEVGKDLASYYSDVIFEVSLTPNLGHCMCIYGIARELSAQLNIPLKKLSFSLSEDEEPIEKCVQALLIDKKQCPRYACRAIKGVTVGPSPEWLQKKIEACGIRSINNIVDIGNLVMLEFGQPLHMFDADKIDGKKIIITAQTDYKELETLDDIKRLIPPEALLICDLANPLAFAGVMGGKSSAVSDHTVNVVIEAAYFTPQAIRKSTRLIGLKSDSSQRFEKGIDPNDVIDTLNYAAFLLQKVAGGKVYKGFIDQKGAHEFVERKIACRISRVNQLLGTYLSAGEVAGFLRRLEMKILQETNQELLVAVPTYRNDISIEVDLIEEIARVYGYNNIPKPIPLLTTSTIPNAPLYLMEKEIRMRLIGEGLQELITCDLISPAQVAMTLERSMDKDALISVLLSHSVDQSVLRASLLPGLLQVVKYNIDHGMTNIAGFEVGRIHFKEKDQYIEPTVAGIVLSGRRAPYHWDLKPEDFDFYDLKGIIENLLASLKIENLEFEPSHLQNFHPGRQAKIKKDQAVLGVMGEVHPERVGILDVPQRIFFAEINLHEVMPLIPKQWNVVDLAQFPGSERDWTVTLKEELPIAEILHALRSVPSRLLEKVILLDLYKSEQIGKDKKNATFRFFYRDFEKTIAYEAVEQEHARITAAAAEKLTRSLL
jgi:phenylalanyl-tRNA synthetase beta chain